MKTFQSGPVGAGSIQNVGFRVAIKCFQYQTNTQQQIQFGCCWSENNPICILSPLPVYRNAELGELKAVCVCVVDSSNCLSAKCFLSHSALSATDVHSITSASLLPHLVCIHDVFLPCNIRPPHRNTHAQSHTQGRAFQQVFNRTGQEAPHLS